MKKRMLVTTIALVLVIAVALTTSSLAWFSSSATVTAGNLEFAAAGATGSNLVLGNLGNIKLGEYDTRPVTLPNGRTMNPAQGNPALGTVGEDPNKIGTLGTIGTDFDVETINNTIIYKAERNPFFKAVKVEQETGFAVAEQKVDLQAGGQYLAGGFNFANAAGNDLSNGVTVNATITLATVAPGTAATGTTVKKGYVAYDGVNGWKSAGETVTDSAVFFNSKDVALLASIRIAMFGAADVINSENKFAPTFTLASICDFNETGVVLTKNGYATADGGSNNNYSTEATTGVKNPAGIYYNSEFKHIEVGEANIGNNTFTFTFSQAFTTPITGGNAGSIAYVIWMDGWDESALPGVSQGTFGMTFVVSVG